MAKQLTYNKAIRALMTLNKLEECAGLTDEEREDLIKAANTVRAICDRIPDGEVSSSVETR